VTSAWEVDFEVCVRHVLALARLSGARVLGGSGSEEKPVAHVRLAPEGRHPSGSYAATAVVMDGGRLADDNYLVDLTLRWMADVGAPLLIVVRPAQEVGLSSRRLADKVGIALVVVDDDILELADEIREVVEAPTRIMSRAIVEAVDRLARVSSSQGVPACLDAVDGTLNSASTLVGLEGEVIAGAELEPPLSPKDRITVPATTVIGERVRLVQPVTLARGERPTFWLVVQGTSPTRAWEEVASRVARLAGSYIATRLISTRLEQERDARVRLGALNAIIALADRPNASLLQQIGTLGWKTDGWCTAVHLRIGGNADPLRVLALTDEMRRVLADADVAGPLVERPDGWTSWLVDSTEPASTSFGELVVRFRRALQGFAADREGMRVYAGIGRPYSGLVGLKKSLAEAQEAATIAQASGVRTAVQHIDELGVQRILVGWYTSEEFGDFARTLLRPVVNIDKDEDLLRTLEVFLDNESSPTATSDMLGLHRNTVIKRMARIRQVLSVDLDDPDQRLAVQLACRVVNLRA
jgi:purine catabolism regulator